MEWTDEVRKGDSTWNRITIGYFWESLLFDVGRFWFRGVGSFRLFFLRKILETFFALAPSSFTFTGSSVCIGS